MRGNLEREQRSASWELERPTRAGLRDDPLGKIWNTESGTSACNFEERMEYERRVAGMLLEASTPLLIP